MFNALWGFLSAWYNLPYTSLISMAMLLAIVQLMGLGGEPTEGADLAADADGDADLDADPQLDHELDHELDQGELGQSALGLLAFLGMGKAPLFVVLPILFGLIGLLGWLFNGAAQSVLGSVAGWAFGLGLMVAVGVGSVASARLARLIGRALPPISTTASRAEALVGRAGTVISPFVDERYGLVHLRNAGGTLMSVFAITGQLAGAAPIRRGQPVVLVAYQAEQRRYVVVPAESAGAFH